MNIVRRILLYCVLAGAVFAAGAAVFVRTTVFREMVRGILLVQLGPLTGGTLAIDSVGGNLVTQVSLEGVSIDGAGGRFIHVERIDAQYFLPSLLRNTLHIRRADIIRPTVSVRADPGGRSTTGSLFRSGKKRERSPSAPGGFVLIVDAARITDGTCDFSAGTARPWDVADINIDASVTVRSGVVAVVLKRLRAREIGRQLSVADTAGTVQFNGPVLNVDALRITTAASELNITGSVTDLTHPVFDLTLHCPRVALADIHAVVPGLRPRGSLATDMRVTGSMDNLNIVQSLAYESLALRATAALRPRVPAFSMTGSVRGLDPRVILPLFTAGDARAYPAGSLSFDVLAHASGRDFDTLRSSVTLRVLPSTLGKTGIDTSVVEAVFDRGRAAVSGDISCRGERFGLSLAGARTAAQYIIESLSIRSPRLTLSAQGTVGGGRAGLLAVDYAVSSADIGLVSLVYPALSCGGTVSSTGTISGRLNAPALTAEAAGTSLRFADASADMLSLKTGIVSFGLPPEGTAELRLSGARLGVQRIDTLAVSASHAGRTSRLTVAARRAPGTAFEADAAIEQQPDGSVAVKVADVKITAASSTWVNDGPVVATVSRRGTSVESLRLVHGVQAISASGLLGRARGMDARITVRRADISEFAGMAGLNMPWRGALSADLAARGTYDDPSIAGTIEARAVTAGDMVIDRIPVSCAYAARTLNFDARMEKSGVALLVSSGTIPVDLAFSARSGRLARTGLRVAVKSAGLGLGILPLFVNQVISASGKIDAELQLAGDPRAPRASGAIGISDGKVLLRATGQEYRNITARVDVADSRARIQKLSMKSGPGTAEIKGTVFLKGLVPSDAELSLKSWHFTVMKTDIFTGDINTDIVMRGLSAAGAVTIAQATVNMASRSKIAVSDIVYVDDTLNGRRPAVPSESPLFRKLALDVDVSIPGKAWLYGMGVTAELNGAVNVTKQPGGPLYYKGYIGVTRGMYKIQDRTLTINAGRLILDGADLKSSLINASASTRVDRVAIDVTMAGTIQRPDFIFRSDPILDRTDILSYLAFGKPAGAEANAANLGLRATSVDVLANFAVDPLKDVVGKVVSLDVLTVQPSAGSIGVGKYITDNLFARYEWRSGKDDRPKTVLEYLFDRHFSLVSQLGDPATSGVDLFWKFSY